VTGRGFAVPPGRAGRLWLRRRLRVARRGAELLDRKLLILQAELDGLRAAAERAAAEWERCSAEAELWLLRASLLDGQRAVRLGADGQFATVTISYGTTMGVRHPSGATCVTPPPATWDGPAMAGTRHAHRAALTAAVRYAAAAEALRVIDAEASATRYRLRAIRDRWIPRLEQALTEVTLAIEEQELADAVRLRLAIGTNVRSLASTADRSARPSLAP
jgi:V/A-type H+/Na+-transporting ATPase subunit D